VKLRRRFHLGLPRRGVKSGPRATIAIYKMAPFCKVARSQPNAMIFPPISREGGIDRAALRWCLRLGAGLGQDVAGVGWGLVRIAANAWAGSAGDVADRSRISLWRLAASATILWWRRAFDGIASTAKSARGGRLSRISAASASTDPHHAGTNDRNYCLSRWDAFTRFLDDGRLCMSNNAAERELRAVAVGRRNWTFAGSDEGGRRAAAIYTLIGSAKLNDVDPQAWLADVLARLPDHPAKRIHDLLSWNWHLQSVAHVA
jgi:transposase IS66 family protein/transposase IS66-like protein